MMMMMIMMEIVKKKSTYGWCAKWGTCRNAALFVRELGFFKGYCEAFCVVGHCGWCWLVDLGGGGF